MNPPIDSKVSVDIESELILNLVPNKDRFSDIIEEELNELPDRVSVYSRPSVFSKSKATRMSINSVDMVSLEEDQFSTFSQILKNDLEETVESFKEDKKSSTLDDKDIVNLVGEHFRKSLISEGSMEVRSLSIFSTLTTVEQDEEHLVIRRKKLSIAEPSEEEEFSEDEISMLKEDEDGNLAHFEEIKKTRVFADRDCPSMSTGGEMDRRNARNLKFDPSLLLTHYTLKDLFLRDDHGWAPIHYCAYRGFRQCIRILIHEVPSLLEYRTKDKRLNATPLLLAVMSFDLDTIKLLIKLGADLSALDHQKHNAIELCTFKQAIDIIEFFLAYDDPRLQVWKILTLSLASKENNDALATAKTIRLMTQITPPWTASCYWKDLLNNRITKSFLRVISGEYSDEVMEHTLCIFVNIICAKPVRVMAVEKENMVSHLALLLIHNSKRLADLAGICIVGLLVTRRYLGNAVNTNLMDLAIQMVNKHQNFTSLKISLDLIGYLMRKYKPFADKFRTVDNSFDIIVNRFVKNKSKTIAFSLLALVEHAMTDSPHNQDLFNDAGLGQHLVKLTKARNRKLMVACLAVVSAMTKDNFRTQKTLEQLGIVPNIITLLKKTRYLTIQELTASTLWTIGGVNVERLWCISEAVGVKVLVEFVESHSKILELIGAQGLCILNQAPLGVHDAFYTCCSTQILTRLLTRTRCAETLLATIRAIRFSCYKSAMVNHPGNQRLALGDYTVQGCVNIIIDYIEKDDFAGGDFVKAECVVLLASMILTNSSALHDLLQNKRFTFCMATRFLESSEEEIRSLAGQALALMCFNMTSMQTKITTYGGIFYTDFKRWMTETKSDLNRSHFAFQLVILARVFPDVKPSLAAAEGIVQLHELLNLKDSDDYYVQCSINAVVRQTCNYIAALCHSRPGIPDSYVAIKTPECLTILIVSSYEQTRAFAAIALGYLSFEPSAKRWILRKFRHDTYLLDILVYYSQDNKCNPGLLESWKYLKYVGLPPKDMSRGDLIRIRQDQFLSEPRPHILTGVEDPHSGAVGASTVEKDDYDDELVFVDDFEERKKIVSNRPDIRDSLHSIGRKTSEAIPCLDKLRMEREKKEELEYLRRLEEMEALEEEEEEDVEEGDDLEQKDEEDDDDDDSTVSDEGRAFTGPVSTMTMSSINVARMAE